MLILYEKVCIRISLDYNLFMLIYILNAFSVRLLEKINNDRNQKVLIKNFFYIN